MGSEMCIRDSDGIALAFAAPGLGAPAPAPLGLKKLLMSLKGLVFFCVSIVSGCAFRTDADARLAMELPREGATQAVSTGSLNSREI